MAWRIRHKAALAVFAASGCYTLHDGNFLLVLAPEVKYGEGHGYSGSRLFDAAAYAYDSIGNSTTSTWNDAATHVGYPLDRTISQSEQSNNPNNLSYETI